MFYLLTYLLIAYDAVTVSEWSMSNHHLCYSSWHCDEDKAYMPHSWKENAAVHSCFHAFAGGQPPPKAVCVRAVRMRLYTESCDHDIVHTTCGNFTRFTT